MSTTVRGRIEFLQSQVDYAFSASGERWQSLILVRAFASTGSVEYAYVDCPTETGADDLADARNDVKSSLSLRG